MLSFKNAVVSRNGKTQIRGTHFIQLGARPEPRQSERRIGAGGDHQV